MRKSVKTVQFIQVCDLCGEPVGETQWRANFLDINQKKIKSERPLKQKWYNVFRFAYDGNPEYDVHHTCLYELLRAYKEGGLQRKRLHEGSGNAKDNKTSN